MKKVITVNEVLFPLIEFRNKKPRYFKIAEFMI